MKNALVSWVLPTTRQEGGPLPVEEIKHVVIAFSADGGTNFAPVGTPFPPDVLSTPINDLPFGDQYVVRGICVDTSDQGGTVVDVPFSVSDSSPPGDLQITIAFP